MHQDLSLVLVISLALIIFTYHAFWMAVIVLLFSTNKLVKELCTMKEVGASEVYCDSLLQESDLVVCTKAIILAGVSDFTFR